MGRACLHVFPFGTAIATVCVVCWLFSDVSVVESVFVNLASTEVVEVTSATSGMPTFTETVSPMAREASSRVGVSMG